MLVLTKLELVTLLSSVHIGIGSILEAITVEQLAQLTLQLLWS